MKPVYRLLFILHLFVGIGAMGGGLMAILNPEGPGGMPANTLKNSPFSNFLIPGIILFSFIGLCNVLSALILHLKSRFQGYFSSVMGWGLMIWIIVQCLMLQIIVSLHVIFFFLGLVQAVLAAAILFKERVFPANIVLHVYKAWKTK